MAARAALEEARGQVAGLLGARPREVVFTSGATEAIAAACWGAAARGTARRTGERAAAPDGRGHQVVAAVEHSAVRRAAARHGEVTVVPVDRRGAVDLEALLAAVRPDTDLVHLQWGNHEVGTLQPVEECVPPAASGRARPRRRGPGRRAGADRLRALGADLLSVSAHKLAGVGAGALLVRQACGCRPCWSAATRSGPPGRPRDLPGGGFGAACAALAAPADGRLALEHEAAE